ncbi:MAG: EAL domain-containing protein [Xanthobacteraceae bacterium]|nr:EAL domain-containing protein [Xanthobacteraceae bacterium]
MRTKLGSYFAGFSVGRNSLRRRLLSEEPIAGHIRAEQLTIVVRHTPTMMMANACNAAVLWVALWTSPQGWLAGLWAGVMIVGSLLAGFNARAYGCIATPQTVSRRAIRRVVWNAAYLGSMWAVVPMVFFATATNGQQLVITSLSAGMLAGGAMAFATIPAAAIAVVGPIVFGTVICVGQSGDFVYLLVAVLAIVYAIVLLRGVFTYSSEFASRLTALFETEKAVREDSLTQLSNRVAFNEDIESALGRLSRSGEQFAVLAMDIDRFKEVNDQLGHPAGDEFLIQIASRLTRAARDIDTVARIGGDEIAFLLTNVTRPVEALEAAERFMATFAEPFLIGGRSMSGSACIGVVLAPRDGDTRNDLLKRVDVALYRAKKTGPGTVRFFQPADDILARERKALHGDLEKAIERGQLFLAYQPFLDLRDNRVTGFEALLRWRHPVRGLVPPDEFIGIAEETGLIHSIGEWVLRSACTTLSQWPEDIRVAVNFSAVQFQQVSVLHHVTSALTKASVSPTRLEVEMTESTSIAKYASTESVVRSLSELGVTIALDDFGTGFSSLTYLRKLPFARIKIDQSFVREMLVNSDCEAIVRSVIGLARDLGIDVVAEGVETEEQLEYLRRAKCNEAQGYFIGRPMTAEQATALLSGSRGGVIWAA